jgi:hypothetical protein
VHLFIQQQLLNISLVCIVFNPQTSLKISFSIAELLELSGNAAHDHKRKRIVPRHILLAYRNDEELNKVCKNK